QTLWTATRLPFAPRGMNGAGVIVGSLNGEAVMWNNGTMSVLPHAAALMYSSYAAVDITPLGKIIGYAGSATMVWPAANQAPQVYVSPVAGSTKLLPVAMNDAGMFVAYSEGSPIDKHIWQYTPTSGLRDLTRRGAPNVIRDLNEAGLAVGYVDGSTPQAFRWDAAGNYTVLPSFNGSSLAHAINSRGDVLGYSGLGTTIWRADGTFETIAAIVGSRDIAGWNDAGRIVGNTNGVPFTFFGGALTYLPLLDGDNAIVVGVSACGWIVGVSIAKPNAGYLWRQDVNTATCDAAPVAIAVKR